MIETDTTGKPVALAPSAAGGDLDERHRMALARALMANASRPAQQPGALQGDPNGGWMTILSGALGGVAQGLQSRQMAGGGGGSLFGSSPPPTKSWLGLAPAEGTFDMDKAWASGFGMSPMDGGGKGSLG